MLTDGRLIHGWFVQGLFFQKKGQFLKWFRVVRGPEPGNNRMPLLLQIIIGRMGPIRVHMGPYGPLWAHMGMSGRSGGRSGGR